MKLFDSLQEPQRHDPLTGLTPCRPTVTPSYKPKHFIRLRTKEDFCEKWRKGPTVSHFESLKLNQHLKKKNLVIVFCSNPQGSTPILVKRHVKTVTFSHALMLALNTIMSSELLSQSFCLRASVSELLSQSFCLRASGRKRSKSEDE